MMMFMSLEVGSWLRMFDAASRRERWDQARTEQQVYGDHPDSVRLRYYVNTVSLSVQTRATLATARMKTD